MSDPFVADSSVGVAWAAFSQGDRATDELSGEVEAGRPLVVPNLWNLEVANALLLLVRRKKMDTAQRVRAVERVNAVGREIDDLGPPHAFGRVSELADQHGLTIYDAVYLELALRRGLPLASRDAALNKAAKRSGVKTLL